MSLAAEVVYLKGLGERRRPNGRQLRAARLAAGMTQRELGRRLAARVGGYEAELAKVLCRCERGTYKTLSPDVWDALVAELAATAAPATV